MTGRVLVTVLALGLVVGGCGDDDDGVPSSEAELAAALVDQQDMSPERAECVAGQAYARLDDDELASLAGKSADQLSDELRSKLRTALTPCASIP